MIDARTPVISRPDGAGACGRRHPTLPADVSESPHPTSRSRNTRVLSVFARAIIAFASFFVTLYWVEAEKETRVLCGLSKTGTSATEVDRLFGTANLLQIRRETAGDRRTLHVASPYNLGFSRCTVTLERGTVTGWSYTVWMPSGSGASFALLLGLAWLAVFHVRNVVSALTPGAEPRESRDPRATWWRVVKEILPATLVLLGIASVVDFTKLKLLPFVAPYAGVVIGVLVMVFLAEFVIARPRGATRARRAAERLFPLVMACSGMVVLLGG